MNQTITLTQAELRAAAEGANALAAEPVPVGLALKLAALLRQLQGPVQDLETVQMHLVHEYTAKDEEGQPLPVSDEDGNVQPDTVQLTDPTRFQQEMQELLNATVEVLLPTLQRQEIEEAGIRVSARTLLQLGALLET